jgi:hypothetical protein
MISTHLPAAVTMATLVFASCSGSPESTGAAAAAAQLQGQHEASISKLFGRPELRDYLMLPESFVGGSFPRGTAVLLREVQQLEGTYLGVLQASSAPNQPVVQAHQALEEFARQAAELYELMASGAASIKATRDGLEISDASLHAQYNQHVDAVNAARDRLEVALRALTAEQQASFSRMRLTVFIKK